ncbi:sulfurtransferase TusA family protein [Streptomyces sp. V1I1]|uniref:sulfurtransferase TusA family protein n=1 Tax=Streptomyces sp. V1I1 TaxID=3042272 RepID=UPI0027828913|nr:sulfurtransferase TusA family protein [Streptomyces sp. V1I1]MDQ0939327.1 tRNA 2-thiouridine synthesizing protein A [Streptomyces sp. V1I1]
MTATLPAPPDRPLVIDGTGMLCVVLLLHLRARIADAPPGMEVHLIADDPAALLDLAAWCHLTGHTYLGPLSKGGHGPVYSFTVTGTAKPTQPTSPWRLDGGENSAPEQ